MFTALRRAPEARFSTLLIVAAFILDLFAAPILLHAQTAPAPNCAPGSSTCALLIQMLGDITEAELNQKKDSQGRNLFIDDSTFSGRGQGWNRDGVELEATNRLVCKDTGQVMDRAQLLRIMREDAQRPDSPWRPFRRMRNPEQLQALSLRYGINEMPWGDDDHNLREQMPYVWLTISNSRQAFEPEGEEMFIGSRDRARRTVVTGPRELSLTTDINDDYYFDTPDYRLLRNGALVRGRMRYDSWRDPSARGGLRMLVATKVLVPPDPSDPLSVKGAFKQDQRRDGASQANVNAIKESVQRGRLPWGNGDATAVRNLYNDLKDKGVLPTIGQYSNVLAMDPKLFIRSIRSRYHLDEVQRDDIQSLYTLGKTHMDALVVEATEVLANTTNAGQQALLQGFLDKVAGIDDEIQTRLSLSANQVNTTRRALERGTVPRSKNMLNRQQAVAEAISEIYHEIGAMLSANDRELASLISGADSDDGADDFRDWLQDEFAEQQVGSLRARRLTAERGYVSIPTTTAVTLAGTFDNIEISTDGGNSWDDATSGMTIDPDNETVEFEMREKPGETGDGVVEIMANLPTPQAQRFRQQRQWGGFVARHHQIMDMPQAEKDEQIEAFNTFHGTNLDEDEFAAIGPELHWQDARRWYKQIEAAGTAARGLWFDNARQFYIPSSRRSWGNFLIDTLDLAGYYTPSASGDDPDESTLFHSELVNEVQIELGLEGPMVDRIRDLTNTIRRDQASVLMKWATATNQLPGQTTRAYRGWLTRFKGQDDAALQPLLDEFNEWAKNEGATWAQDSTPEAPAYPLTASELRALETSVITVANRDRDIRDERDVEDNRAGSQFIFDEYRRAQRMVSELKKEQVIDGVNWAIRRARRNGVAVPACDEWDWVQSDQAKGERGLGMLLEKEQPPTVNPNPGPGPVVVQTEGEPNDSRTQVRSSTGPNNLVSGSVMKGRLELQPSRDVDTFRIKMPRRASGATQKIVIDLKPPAGQNLNLLLFNASDNRPIAISSNTGDSPEKIEFDVTSGSSFYARVTHGAGATAPTGDYELTAVFDPSQPAPPPAPTVRAEVEPNDRTANVRTGGDHLLVSGQELEGVVGASGDIDTFRIDLPPGATGPITVKMETPAGLDYDLRLFDDNRQFVTASANRGAGAAEELSLQTPSGTTYFVKVQGYRRANSATDKYKLTATY